MGFFQELNVEQKQHLNLSIKAQTIIRDDMVAFGINSMSGILNQVISCFKDVADASIYERITEKKESLLNIFSDYSHVDREKIISRILSNCENELKLKSSNYESGKGIKFRINNENMEFLTSKELCKEDTYYDSLGKYIKALIEEYSGKSFFDREEIIKKEIIETIVSSIHSENQIKIALTDGKIIVLKPYKITSDELRDNHYLLGILVPNDERLYQNVISVRISSINAVHILRRNGHISKEKKDLIENEEATKGVPFIGKKLIQVKVQFSKKGEKNYRRITNLRPSYLSKDKGVYTFFCSEEQAKFYFFRFGKEAKILEPKILAEHMRTEHQKAANMYEMMGEI